MWEVIDNEREIYVVPIDDLLPHINGKTCRCGPTLEKNEEGLQVITHNAYDGRELMEDEYLGIDSHIIINET